MFEILDLTKDNIIAFKAEGKIEKTDYDKITPVLEKTEREHQNVRLLLEIGDLKSITFDALLKDIATYFKHVKHLEKVAVVGRDHAEKSWTKVADPFIRADIKYFPLEEMDIAKEWISR